MVNCGVPEVPNGVMKTSYRVSYTYQDTVLFDCKSGFKLKDNRGRTSCGADSTWQPSLPECVPGKYFIYFDQCLILNIISVALNHQFSPLPFPYWPDIHPTDSSGGDGEHDTTAGELYRAIELHIFALESAAGCFETLSLFCDSAVCPCF